MALICCPTNKVKFVENGEKKKVASVFRPPESSTHQPTTGFQAHSDTEFRAVSWNEGPARTSDASTTGEGEAWVGREAETFLVCVQVLFLHKDLVRYSS